MATVPPTRAKVSTHTRDRSRAGMLLALPTALVVSVFFVLPPGLLVWMSFNHWPLIGASRPNGLADYEAVTDPLSVRTITFTPVWTVLSTAALLVVSLGPAPLVQEPRRGVGIFRTLFLLPGVLPGTVTAALHAFLAGWNEFIGPLILLPDGSEATLPVAPVAQRSGTLGQIDFGALQAGVAIAAIPCGLLFLLLQRHYVKGFSSGALKG